MSFQEEMKSNDHRRQLEAIRDKLTIEIEHCESARDLAPLTRQLAEVVTQLADLPSPSGESEADQVAAKRRARRQTA